MKIKKTTSGAHDLNLNAEREGEGGKRGRGGERRWIEQRALEWGVHGYQSHALKTQ